jgi:hypothetical protein
MGRWGILWVIVAMLALGCSSDDSSSPYYGYVSPGDFVAKALPATSFTLNGVGGAGTCASGHCSAVFHYGYIYPLIYEGFAVRDTQDNTIPATMNLKVYWVEVLLTTGTITRNVTATLKYGGNYYSTTQSLTMDIVANPDGTYDIDLNSGIAFPSGPTVTGTITALGH